MPQATALVDVGLSVARWGANNALALAVAGVVVMVLGQRAFRPVAALLAGAGAGVAVALAVSKWLPDPPVSAGLLIAGAAVAIGVVGLLTPTFATVASAMCFGWVAGDFVATRSPAHAETAIVVGVLGACIAASVMAAFLPRFVTAVAGGVGTALGVWAYTGATGLSAALFRVPAVWVVLASVLVVVACAVEQARYKAVLAAGGSRYARAVKKARAQKEKEDRERYERYMQ